MKKIVLLLTACVLMLLTACGTDNTNADSKNEQTATVCQA